MATWFSHLKTLLNGLPHIDPRHLPPSFAEEVLPPVTRSADFLEQLSLWHQTQELLETLSGLSVQAGERTWYFWERASRLFAEFCRAESCLFFSLSSQGALHKIHPLHAEEDSENLTWPVSPPVAPKPAAPQSAAENLIRVDLPNSRQNYFLRLDQGKARTLVMLFQTKPVAPPIKGNHLLGLLSLAHVIQAVCAPHFPSLEQVTELEITGTREEEKRILGRDPAFLKALQSVEQAAPSEATVYLKGESGTGKELFAKHLHNLSSRGEGPFVPINCSAIPTELIESEMFGHEKGAFTGAYYRKIGKVEQAHGGTLFLDEIGEMPLAFQAKLLRYLQEKKFNRVGGNASIHADARVVVATHRDLLEMVGAKTFREDLYYRIHVIPITIPPLRERGSDIRYLGEMFFKKFIDKSRASRRKVDETVFDILDRYPFPGNVRELENIIQRTVVMTQKPVISAEDLPAELIKAAEGGPLKPYRLHPFEKFDTLVPEDRETLKALKKEIDLISFSYQRDLDRRFLLQLLEKGGGSVRKAAELAAINRTLFYKLLKRAGLDIGLLNKEDA